MKARSAAKSQLINTPIINLDIKRDAYGFAVRPQHVHRYREYANIYKEEEMERSDRWKDFLERQAECAELPVKGLSVEENRPALHAEANEVEADASLENGIAGVVSDSKKSKADCLTENVVENDEVPPIKLDKICENLTWTKIRPSLGIIEDMMSSRVKKTINKITKDEQTISHLSVEDSRPAKGGRVEDSGDDFYDVDKSESFHKVPLSDSVSALDNDIGGNVPNFESFIPWKEELECLVQGGVPMALRGELWQAFVGARTRRVEKYYQNLLDQDNGGISVHQNSDIDNPLGSLAEEFICIPEKWKVQIEKDLPRTFPGHPALDEDGRNALRRLLTAYARHNPSVGYCQAMNFFAGLLLLLMPEENAFWTLLGILDDYFDGYYSEEMIESQVDQQVFEELVRERFPKLVNHLDYLEVPVASVTGPWFLSIFMNMMPWESVLRVWDVLLFEGNRVMVFRTALALLELYGPALVTTKDAGDAVTLLQSLAGSTFDSSQLVLTACMGYPNVNESRLQELRNKNRPAVRAAAEERSSRLKALSGSANSDKLAINSNEDPEHDSVPDLQEQVVWLKVELCKSLEEKRSAVLRAEELETALMEMVKQDNRRQLSAKVERLERVIVELREALLNKHEQENAMLQVLMRVENDQRVTEDARLFAEQDAAAQRYAAQMLQEKYEAATASLAEMENRVVMAESMLEATLQYQSKQHKPRPTQRSIQQDSSAVQNIQAPLQDSPERKLGLLSRPFGSGWRDRHKGKSTNNSDGPNEQKEHMTTPEGESLSTQTRDIQAASAPQVQEAK
ncbi:hypothetical protein DCAR_0415533 [Daucus carota subsp. sativus]|uniref:Rab-GAP TBC domain-containing protein n=1 Tax=Daucus carota subsp. sativus TaxID=79200 RepID=A0AAF0WUB4_DAUCS|nr:hypothetical protein DCAR_0415533 [Daucus carota subsp. sativus]